MERCFPINPVPPVISTVAIFRLMRLILVSLDEIMGSLALWCFKKILIIRKISLMDYSLNTGCL